MRASARDDVCHAVRQVYDELAEELSRHRPVCQLSGRCCKFEEFGHRLYVTTMELAAFMRDLSPTDVNASEWTGRGCPFQRQKLCGVHAIRPFGCRLFFCDSNWTSLQDEVYERFHTALKRHHDELAVPYFYLEWRHALRELRLIDSGHMQP